MRHTLILLLVLAATTAFGQHFTRATYAGDDSLFTLHPLREGQRYTPILQGCYPDPSICRAGDDYYLVCSSFAMFPGVPIFHSRDLVTWTQIGHVLDRPSQLKVGGAGASNGIYAPTIRYCAHNQTFYMITTQTTHLGNMMVKTRDPRQGWSDPIDLHFAGIDPSIFFDDDGRAYIVHNDAPKKALWSGHRAIRLWEYDLTADTLIAGTSRIIVDGGTRRERHPFWIEAPHLYKKDGRYYLMCAEGGTGANHSEVVFMADSVGGPYREAPNNPILTQRHLDPARPFPVTCAGHTDVVDTPDGQWWGVFLGVRPNSEGHSLTARETFLLPVDWSGLWPVFQNGLVAIEPTITGGASPVNTGNFTLTDSFPTLSLLWVGERANPADFAQTGPDGLHIRPFAANITERKPLSAMWLRQMHGNFTFTATLVYQPQRESDLAGIASFQSRDANLVLGLTLREGRTTLVLARRWKGSTELLAAQPVSLKRGEPIELRLTARGEQFQFAYALPRQPFTNLGPELKADFLTTELAGGFVGNMLGLYATSNNHIQ